MPHSLPRSIAIAGAWGYIGQKLLEAAQALEMHCYVFDPGPPPADLANDKLERIASEAEFYQLKADLFHLALHPKHRSVALSDLFDRAQDGEDLLVLCEKPMVDPSHPGFGPQIIEASENASIRMLFNYIELYDPMTWHIHDYLAQFDQVSIKRVELYRSKDREDPENPRNYKIMAPIQYQESVHCIAYLLQLLTLSQGSFQALFEHGLKIEGTSLPYKAPNPEDYAYEVDGKVDGRLWLGGCEARLHTDFKRKAPFTKRRTIEGVADGQAFCIEAEYLEGHKQLRINGEDQGFEATASTYESVIRQAWRWKERLPSQAFSASGPYPNARFAWNTYLFSALLWDSCRTKQAIELADYNAFQNYSPRFPHYHKTPAQALGA